MLPFCDDEVLLDELAAVITAGGRLPSLPDSAAKVAHLLLLDAPDAAEEYRTRAERLLAKLDSAIRDGRLNDADEELTDEQRRGLRILFGLDADYRARLASSRRENAADYLVPGWDGGREIKDRAGSFQRRHQERVCGLMLSCLKAVYGQEDRPSEFELDDLWDSREYWVDARRQVYRVRSTVTIQARVDQLEHIYFYQFGSVLEGFESQQFLGLETPDGLSTIISVEETEQVGAPDFITLRLPRTIRTSERCSYGWEQTIRYGPGAPKWKAGFFTFGSRNDDFGFDVTIRFEGERPEKLWWLEDLPLAEHVHPRTGQDVPIQPDGLARYLREPPTNRGTAYGLAWRW